MSQGSCHGTDSFEVFWGACLAYSKGSLKGFCRTIFLNFLGSWVSWRIWWQSWIFFLDIYPRAHRYCFMCYLGGLQREAALGCQAWVGNMPATLGELWTLPGEGAPSDRPSSYLSKVGTVQPLFSSSSNQLCETSEGPSPSPPRHLSLNNPTGSER